MYNIVKIQWKTQYNRSTKFIECTKIVKKFEFIECTKIVKIYCKILYIRCTKSPYSGKNSNSLNVQYRENSMENCVH